MSLKWLLMACSALLLAACAAAPSRDGSIDASPAGSGLLEAFVTALPGRFGSASRLDNPDPGVLMLTDLRAVDDNAIVLEFIEPRDDGNRGFALVLERHSNGPFIAGQFAPIQADGTLSTRTCPMRFRLLQGLLSGETDPITCQFGSAENSVGLLKEVALSVDQIVIADQLTGPGQHGDESPNVLRLHRLARFRGSVRVREKIGAAWRMAEPVELEAGMPATEPVDAAGMGLDVGVEMRLVQGQEAGEPLLYLQIDDVLSGEVMGQAWTDVQADRIGLALDRIQIDLLRR
jgi:hypothetical protein